jgi:hypothetical protein
MHKAVGIMARMLALPNWLILEFQSARVGFMKENYCVGANLTLNTHRICWLFNLSKDGNNYLE